MRYLIKSVVVIDSQSPFNHQTVDILIEKGKIKRIGKHIEEEGECKIISIEGLHVSPGWFDFHVTISEPGYEYKETIQQTLDNAAKGGFTAIAAYPETSPFADNKAVVEYIIQQSRQHIVSLYPVGLFSRKREGMEMADYYEMKCSGAVAFSDNKANWQDRGLLYRVMQYLTPFRVPLILYPMERTLMFKQSVWESKYALQLGFKGIPFLAQDVAVINAVQIAEKLHYPLHLFGVVSPSALKYIRKKKKDLITVSVPSYHLYLDEKCYASFDARYKTQPPLLPPFQVKKIKDFVKDGTIDIIVSDHYAHNTEAKKCEWNVADYGMHNLLTSFSLMMMSLGEIVPLDQLIETITVKPRRLLSLPPVTVREEAVAELTFFLPQKEWILEEKYFSGRGAGSPLTGMKLKGKAIAIFKNNQWKEIG